MQTISTGICASKLDPRAILSSYTFLAALRGAESEHIEFLQLAKGKDTGFLQVAVFESKISGGSAIAFTSRDQFRLCECMVRTSTR